MLAEFDYTIREDGRRTGVVEKFWVDTSSGVEEVTNTVSWEYDELNRLIDEVFVTDADDLLDPVSLPAGTRAWTDYTDHYTYDLTGNRLEKTTDLGNNSTVDETVSYEYDSNDRLLASPEASLSSLSDGSSETASRILLESGRILRVFGIAAVYSGIDGSASVPCSKCRAW